MKTTVNEKIPKEVVETFEYWLGNKIDLSKIVCLKSDGYREIKHGEFDMYVIRRGSALYRVKAYEDGHLAFGNN